MAGNWGNNLIGYSSIRIRTDDEERAYQTARRSAPLSTEDEILRRIGVHRVGSETVSVNGVRPFSGQAFRMADEPAGKSWDLEAILEGTTGGRCRLDVRMHCTVDRAPETVF